MIKIPTVIYDGVVSELRPGDTIAGQAGVTIFPFNEYFESLAVVGGSTVTIINKTISVENYVLVGIIVTGQNKAEIEVFINGQKYAKDRLWYTEFSRLIPIPSQTINIGETLEVFVNNASPTSANFEARLLGYTF